MNTTVPDWLLERYVLGDLPPERMREVAARLAAEPGADTRIAALKDSNEEILRVYPPTLVVHRHRASGDETLPDGAVAAKGDLVQVSYVAAGRKYGAVVSIDGRGTVTRHLPDRGAQAPKLERGGAIALPSAYELDDAPKFERFFFVTADAPFPIAPVLDAARDLAARPDAATADLPLPADLSEASFLLRKETP